MLAHFRGNPIGVGAHYVRHDSSDPEQAVANLGCEIRVASNMPQNLAQACALSRRRPTATRRTDFIAEDSLSNAVERRCHLFEHVGHPLDNRIYQTDENC